MADIPGGEYCGCWYAELEEKERWGLKAEERAEP